MRTLHRLTLQTATAVARLAELQRRADRITQNHSPIAKTALAELSTALEELQVANEALQTQVDEMAGLRVSAESAFEALDEFAQALPIPALWTDHTGVIEKGNDAASQLLNVAKSHLVGKPLMLFIPDRDALFSALRCLSEANAAAVDVNVTVRPREQRPRKLTMAGRRLQHDAACLWFFHGEQLTSEEVQQHVSTFGM